jgi:hypothetical protein
MKALSVSSGFAALFGDQKTIEFRTWETSHRGELLICSNGDLVPGTIARHALHIVDLKEVRPFTRKDMDAACLDTAPGKGYAWVFDYVCPVVPFKVRGKPGLFDVEDRLIQRVNEAEMSSEEIDAYIREHIIPLLTA